MSFQIVYSELLQAHNVHTHINYEMLYITEGEAILMIGRRRFRLSTGNLVFLNQFDEHATNLCSDVYRRYYLLIPPAEMDAFQRDLKLLSVFRFHGADFPYVLDTGDAKSRFDQYFQLMLSTAQNGGEHVKQRISALVTLVLTDAFALRPDMFMPEKDGELMPLQEILADLDRSFAQPPTLPELAARCHVSVACFSRRFRKYVGISPMQYITQNRLTYARFLLLNSDLSVIEIAVKCGYNDVSNFVRRFRQQFQISPLQFRLRNRNHQTEPMQWATES